LYVVIVGIFAVTGPASPAVAEVPNNKPDAMAVGNERSGFANERQQLMFQCIDDFSC
jgi:hypothetical protein